MHRALQMRLNSALLEKEMANEKKQENEAFYQVALAYQEIEMKKLVDEFNRLKEEVVENYQVVL